LDNISAESIAHVEGLQKQMDKFIERQMETVELCANSVRGPQKVTFRPLDHDNVQLWTRQVEDVFDTMGIDGQLNRFTTLTQ
jgi:hypothetical protein